MIYLDNAATTQVDNQVKEAMLPYLNDIFANPSSKFYKSAINANDAVKNARQNVSELLGCDDEEIIFTSGASESNNFIIKGVSDYYRDQGNHIITSQGEHKSVLESCKFLEKNGFEITYLPIKENGHIDIEDLKESIKNNTILVSLIWANNELGALNNIKKISKITNENDIFLHVDATQYVGKKEINLKNSEIDFLSFSAHKIYGPKGIGAAYISKDDIGIRQNITPLIHGGEQEFGLRGSTLATHNIVGFGKAAEITNKNINSYYNHLEELENYFKENIKIKIPEIMFNGNQKNKIPGIINMTIPGIHNQLFIKSVKDELAISTGSACSIGKPSHVLSSLGLDKNQIRSTLRISFGKYNKKNDISIFLKKIFNYITNFNTKFQ
ncbi:cysteine desulfurase family protein [Halanaerobium congolense]|jgi:cysteine desulfurase|uniref:cysteine desulfurase n=1 Tax=Halanaerobium congolense TaxID=54121 RepID=A0A4R7DVS8_9FIRM|nr:cysteine desulfurase family protein [Halanaerobium congolense]TDS26200.1 cysteine desulfurase [Halanaerobium congolense]SDK99869.1 cysteine desulfurase [Halanaerobium congolense]SDN05548.1 cysteine desulfurase [Halanaerobium congolense]